MQSNGGLSDEKNFKGINSILSGPAGGVIGAIAIANKSKYKKIITFDMGGTSTVTDTDGEEEVGNFLHDLEISCRKAFGIDSDEGPDSVSDLGIRADGPQHWQLTQILLIL